MKVDSITMQVKLAWWVKPYCYAMVTWYHLTGREQSADQIAKWVTRGVKIEVAR